MGPGEGRRNLELGSVVVKSKEDNKIHLGGKVNVAVDVDVDVAVATPSCD